MAFKLAEAFVEIKGDKGHLQNALSSSRASLKRFSAAAPGMIMGVTKAMAGLGVAAGVTATAFSVLAVQTTRSFARLQQNMRQVSTMIKGDWQKTTSVLTKGVRQLSLDIPQTTSELSNALYDILSASVPVSKSMEALGVSGKAAVAGISDVTTAANLITGTINGLGMAFDSMQDVSDLAFSTVAEGKLTFAELAGSIGRAIPAANKMGASAKELYGSMAFLTKNALSAEMSATALGATYDELAAKSVDLKAKFGVNVFGDAGEYRGLAAIIEDIAGSLSGLTQQAKTNVLEEMGFERQSARAIVTMTTNLESFRSTMANVEDSAGATEEAYNKMKDTLVNQWETLKNSVTNLAMVIGESFAGAASSAIQKTKEMIDTISGIIEEAGGLTNLWKEHSDVVKGLFKEIAITGVSILAKMLSTMGTVMAAGAPLVWKPLLFHFKKTWNKIGTELGVKTTEVVEGIVSKTAKGLERLKLAPEGSMEGVIKKVSEAAEKERARTWGVYYAGEKDDMTAYKADMEKLITDFTTTLGAESIGFWDSLTISFSHIASAAVEAAEKITKLKEVSGAGITVDTPTDLAVDTSRVKASYQDLFAYIRNLMTDYSDMKQRASATQALITDLQNIWANFFDRRSKADTEADIQRLKEMLDRADAEEARRIELGIKGTEEEVAERLRIQREYNDLIFAEEQKTQKRIAGLKNIVNDDVMTGLQQSWKDTSDAIVATSAAQFDRIAALWDNVAEVMRSSMQDIFGDALSGNLRSWTDFLKSLRNIFSREIADFASGRISKLIRRILPTGDTQAKIAGADTLAGAASSLSNVTSNHIPATAALNSAAEYMMQSAASLGGSSGIVSGGDTAAQTAIAAYDSGQQAPGRQRSSGNTYVFNGSIVIPEADLESMSQAKINTLFEKRFFPAMKYLANKGKINPVVVGRA